jgi:hypothetical protein
VNIEEQNLVKFVMSAGHIPDNRQLAVSMAQRYGLSGAEEILSAGFN